MNENFEIGSSGRQATSQTAGDRLEHHNSSDFYPQHAQFRVGGQVVSMRPKAYTPEREPMWGGLHHEEIVKINKTFT